MTSDQVSLLNSLKGAAACILWALVFNGKPMDRKGLVDATGYKRNTVSKGLKTLVDSGLIEHLGRCQGWYLTGLIHDFELPGLFEDEPTDEDEWAEDGFDDEKEPASRAPKFSPYHELESDQKTNNSPLHPQDVGRETKNSPFGLQGKDQAPKKSPQPAQKPAGTTKKWSLPDDSVNPVVEIHPPDLKNINQVKQVSTTTDLSQGLDPELLRAFHSAGLSLNPRTRLLALLPHVTPGYVRAHYARLKADGKADRTGLLITILESGMPPPETYPNGHLKGCDCHECMRKYRYRIP